MQEKKFNSEATRVSRAQGLAPCDGIRSAHGTFSNPANYGFQPLASMIFAVSPWQPPWSG